MSTEVLETPLESNFTPLVESDRESARTTARAALAILGTRGIPARHGGFETFAERLALYLVDRGWEVTVYCQRDGSGSASESSYEGVRLVEIPEPRGGAWGTVKFDFKSTLAARRDDALILTLGYNTAIFNGAFRLTGRANIINMDGLEWQRAKWGRLARAWLYLNERLGCRFGTHLIADHPEIARHLAKRVSRRKITMIPYGSDEILEADADLLMGDFGLRPKEFALVVARPEPENSLLEIVSGFSASRRGYKLVVLGRYEPKTNPYHARVIAAASDEVIFAGPMYDPARLAALRFFARLYIHGHTVGGTNPALVEALGAGAPVLAHDNRFNRWVAGDEARYFGNAQDCDDQLTVLLDDGPLLARMSAASRARHAEAFTWERILAEYESLLRAFLPVDTIPVSTPAIEFEAESVGA